MFKFIFLGFVIGLLFGYICKFVIDFIDINKLNKSKVELL